MKLGCLILLSFIVFGGFFACRAFRSKRADKPSKSALAAVSPSKPSAGSPVSTEGDSRLSLPPLVVCDSWFGSSRSQYVRAYGEGLWFDGVPVRWDGAGRPVFPRVAGSFQP